VQLVPQPYDQLAFEVDGREWLRYHYGVATPKPYFSPVLGPAGRTITRITHPHDPHGHGHHLSLWIAHHDVGGVSFWQPYMTKNRIVHDRIVKLTDGSAGELTLRSNWLADEKPLMMEERSWTFAPRFETMAGGGDGEYFLDVRLTLTPVAEKLLLGKTPFGFVAVRVAKTMGVADGEGRIINSEGHLNEPQTHWQRAKWCDYSGFVNPGHEANGITLMDHPANPRHPTHFHTRNDGWMGAAFAHTEAFELTRAQPLVLRYRFWVHALWCDPVATTAQWNAWSHS